MSRETSEDEDDEMQDSAMICNAMICKTQTAGNDLQDELQDTDRMSRETSEDE